MTSERFEVSPFTINKAGPTAINFQQISNFTPVYGQSLSRIRPGGTLDAVTHVMTNAQAQVTFNTQDLLTFFTEVSPSIGLAVVSPGATFRLQERADCGAFLTGATHLTITSALGCAYPLSYTASQDSNDPVELQGVYAPHYNGTVEPLAVNNGVDFAAAPAAAFVSAYAMGPVFLNTTEVRGVTQHGIDFGLNYVRTPTTPATFPHAGSFNGRDPTMTTQTRKKDVMASLGSPFIAGVGGEVAFYLQQLTAYSGRTPRATAAHIKLSCTAAAISVQSESNEAGQDAMVTYAIKPVGALSVAVNQVIPAVA